MNEEKEVDPIYYLWSSFETGALFFEYILSVIFI